MGETKNAYNILAEEHDGKRPLGELQHKWEWILEKLFVSM